MTFARDIVAAYFEPGGPMEQHIKQYRHRDEQVQMAQAVADAFSDQEFLVAEVGTGVGKSFAYLLPAILWSLNSGEKVVVSTRTRALQQQLIEHDIPDLEAVIKQGYTCAEAKGRENYLCWNQYMSILAGKRRLDKGEQAFMEAVLHWAETTGSGDRKELGLPGQVMKHWGLLAANRRSCARELCPYRDKCFRLKMLKRLEKADLIVVNHALLLSDLLVDNSILPEYHYLIIDEAHTFERESFDKLSARFSREECREMLHLLYSKERKYERGYLQYLKGRYSTQAVNLNELVNMVNRCLELLEACFAAVKPSRPREDHARVLEYEDFESDWFAEMVGNYTAWQHSTNLLIHRLVELKAELAGEDEEMELNGLIQTLREGSEQAFMVMEEGLDHPDTICWIQYQDGQPLALSSSSIRIGELLHQRLYSKLKSLVMVSATLTIEDSFDYFIEKTGLNYLEDSDRVQTLLQYSPFDYDTQAFLVSLSDMPDPASPGFSAAVSAALQDILTVTQGRTMALFTSRKELQAASLALRGWAGEQGLCLLVQDEDGEFKYLMEQFVQASNTVLMGLETFWEGIDLKGDVLQTLVMVRLPFRSPADPFCSAGDRYYRLQKRSSFKGFMLPDAAVRFKQGAGRLIRSESDRGLFIVLDARLEKRSYGRVFKNSIPIKKAASIKRAELSEFMAGPGMALLSP
ncbi:MAG: ATP-dependent DNA helicase [Syntrophomonadaceae bacterium]|jgi:ATP-dependent DNA helicase DinG